MHGNVVRGTEDIICIPDVKFFTGQSRSLKQVLHNVLTKEMKRKAVEDVDFVQDRYGKLQMQIFTFPGREGQLIEALDFSTGVL